MRKVFNRKVISNKKKIIDESIVRSKKHYNGLIHAGILRENRLHKKQIKEDAISEAESQKTQILKKAEKEITIIYQRLKIW